MSCPMNCCERGSWIDTEGTVVVHDLKGLYRVEVSQDERGPLEDYCAGAIRDGVPCNVKSFTDPGRGGKLRWRARVYGAEKVARELILTREYIRTPKKLRQVEKFLASIFHPRRRLKHTIKRARELLLGFS